MWRYILFAIVILGCEVTSPQSQTQTTHNIASSLTTIDAKATDISKATKEGKTKASQLPHWDWIDGYAQSIKQETTRAREQVSLAEKDLQAKAIQIVTLQKQVKDLQEQVKDSAKWMWRLLIGFSGLAVAGGVTLSVFGNRKLGISLVVGGIAVASVSQFMLTYGWILALIAGVFLIGALSWVAWEAWDHRKTLLSIAETPVIGGVFKRIGI